MLLGASHPRRQCIQASAVPRQHVLLLALRAHSMGLLCGDATHHCVPICFGTMATAAAAAAVLPAEPCMWPAAPAELSPPAAVPLSEHPSLPADTCLALELPGLVCHWPTSGRPGYTHCTCTPCCPATCCLMPTCTQALFSTIAKSRSHLESLHSLPVGTALHVHVIK